MLHDDDEMLFGKHKGLPLSEVPADYLLWLWDAGVWADKHKPIHHYIKDNFNALIMDAPDFIVSHHP